MYFSSPGTCTNLAYVVVVELEILALEEVLDVLQAAGDQVVHGDHMVAFLQEPIAQVRSQETGGTGDEDAFFLFAMDQALADTGRFTALRPTLTYVKPCLHLVQVIQVATVEDTIFSFNSSPTRRNQACGTRPTRWR
jgi:hypothetical protein